MYNKKKKHDNVECNIHVFINSTCIASLLIVNLLFISTHWDHTRKPIDENKYTFTVTQGEDTWVRYPTDGHSIPNMDFESLSTFLLCCGAEKVYVCGYSGYDASIQTDKGVVYLIMFTRESFNDTTCELTWK